MRVNKEKVLHIRSNYYCNNNCIFCMEPQIAKDVNLDKTHVFNILKKYRNKVDRVLFTKKEPTLNPDLVDYIKYAKTLGYDKIAIVSNGRRFSYLSYCLNLIKYGVNIFTISIHGHNARLYDSMTRTPGSFRQTFKGLRNLSNIRTSFPITLWSSTVLSKLNYQYVQDILEFLLRFNLDIIIFNVVQPRGKKMEQSFSSLMPKYSDIAKNFENLHNKKKLSDLTSVKLSLLGIPCCVGDRSIEHILGHTEFIKRVLPSGKVEDIESVFSKGCCALKRQQCRSCKFFTFCEGIPKIYIEHFGWDEFQPVKSP